MKKTLFVVFLTCITLMFSSCKKEKSLNGTTWKGSISDTEQLVSPQGEPEGTMAMKIDITLKFTNATQGIMSAFSSATLTTPDGQTFPQTMPNQDDQTANFNYTFDGNNGTMTGTDEDGTHSLSFIYTKKDNTITMKNVIDFGDIMGTDTTGTAPKLDIVFTEVK